MVRTARRSRLAIVGIAALMILSVVVSGSALAAPGGSGGKSSISFSMNPHAVVGQQYEVRGTGFTPNTWVTVGGYYADTTWWASGITDGLDTFRLTLTATGTGEILHEAKEQMNNGRLRLGEYG